MASNSKQLTDWIPGISQLFSPLSYLRIKQKVKFYFDVVYPIAVTTIVLLAAYSLPEKVNVFGTSGVIFQISELLKMLIGFYIASLAAIATFQAAALDQPLSGSTATLWVSRRGAGFDKSLTRRQFLCYLFGYLAFMSLFMFSSGMLAVSLAADIKNLIDPAYQIWVKGGFSGVYILILSHMLIATLLGLHYLTDRLHRPPETAPVTTDQ